MADVQNAEMADRTDQEAEEARDILRNIVLTAIWDGKPHHIHRNMIVPEQAIEHARAFLLKTGAL